VHFVGLYYMTVLHSMVQETEKLYNTLSRYSALGSLMLLSELAAKFNSSYFELSDLKFLMNQYYISTSTHWILHLSLFSCYFSVLNTFIFLFFPPTVEFLKAVPSVPVIGKMLIKHPLNQNILLTYLFSIFFFFFIIFNINWGQFSFPENEGNLLFLSIRMHNHCTMQKPKRS